MAEWSSITTSAAMTRSVGTALAGELAAGDVLVLSGDLGAGKTVLAQGIGAGLGVTEPVVSPTFTIMREYLGRIRLHHLDVYRFDRLQEAIDLGLDERLDEAVTVIEWGDRVRSVLPVDRLEITLELLPPDEADDDTRRITVTALGTRWAARVDALRGALSATGAGVAAAGEARS